MTSEKDRARLDGYNMGKQSHKNDVVSANPFDIESQSDLFSAWQYGHNLCLEELVMAEIKGFNTGFQDYSEEMNTTNPHDPVIEVNLYNEWQKGYDFGWNNAISLSSYQNQKEEN